jgi:16S rRNA A1518/A1519 N6-dimethyltransferase RsmA/KsgA/DIM1 with predicted DNA glycosylase/AP lyase activity
MRASPAQRRVGAVSRKPRLLDGDIIVQRFQTNRTTGERTLLPALRCPGGPRMNSYDVKALYRVPNCGYLAKHDWRFVMNLNTTHGLVQMLNRTKAVDKLYVELGPGPGMLTRSLLTLPSLGVFGIELDTKYNASLDAIRAHTRGRFTWANADVKDVDEAALLEKTCPEVTQWLASTAAPSTFIELRRKLQAMRRRRAEHETHRLGASPRGDGVTDEELDAMLAGDRDPTGGSTERLVSPFADDEAGDAGTVGPVTGGSCEATSTLWQGSPKIEVVGNLPFEIAAEMATRYAVDCSRRHNLFKYGRVPFHLFFQKEVAERAIAVAGSANFGRLTVLLQNYFSVQIKRTFVERTYYPSTEVLGALVTLEPRVTPIVEVDGAVLSNFCDVVLASKKRTQSVFAALKRCMPSEVATYILAELRIDGQLLPTMVSATEIAKMALLWIRYLEATSQGDPAERPMRHSGAAVVDAPRRHRAEREGAQARATTSDDDDDNTPPKTSYW